MKSATLALVAGLVVPAAAWGQQPSACGAARSAGPDTLSRPDIAILARVEARSLRFNNDPDASLNVRACPSADTTHVVLRTNLPKPVRSGVTYQNVRVELLLKVRLTDADCLLADALARLSPDTANVARARACARNPEEDQ